MATKSEAQARHARITELEDLICKRQDDLNVADGNFRIANQSRSLAPEGERKRHLEIREMAVAYSQMEAEQIEHRIELKQLLLARLVPPIEADELEEARLAFEAAVAEIGRTI